MSDGPIPLARPDVGAREEELVLDVMRSGRLSLGPMLARFERDFANWMRIDGAVAVSSGTAALHLGVRALEWGRGDEVVTSPFSFVASANCLLYEDVTPVFCDIDPETLNIDPQAAKAACGSRTAGLLPIHIFGYPADMEELEGIASPAGLGILEDACEALGAVDAQGVNVGARGHPAAFAFYANKQLTTGEGGMLAARDAGLRERVRSERNQGRGEDMDWLGHDRLGFNYRLSDVAAAIGVAQLERVDALLAQRSRVAALYADRLRGIEGVELPCPDRGQARRSWFVYVVQLPDEADRDGLIRALGERGIASKAYLPCIHLQPFYRERFGFRGGEFPVAERVSSRSLALPFFTQMTEGQVDRVCEALRELVAPGAAGRGCTLSGSVASRVHTYAPPSPRRGERFLALLGLIAAGAVPAILYHELLGQVWSNFTLDAGYIAFGASGFALIGLGLLASLPVVLSIGRNPDSRLYPRSRGALAGWGVSLYLLGMVLVIQIGAIAANW